MKGVALMSRRILFLLTVVALMVVMVALSGATLAQGGDVCVSNKGQTKVQKGTSSCSSDATSHAVATNDSTALAGGNCTAKAQNGELESCA